MDEATVHWTAVEAWLGAGSSSAAMSTDPSHRDRAPSFSLAEFVALTERASRERGNPWLGWSIGLEFDLAAVGDVGLAILSARTLRGALQRFVDYFTILQDTAEIGLSVSGGEASFTYRIPDPDIWPRHQDALFTLAIVAKVIRDSVGAGWSDVQIYLEADGAQTRTEAAKVLGARCSFGAETNAIRFPAAMLDGPLRFAGGARALDHAKLTRDVAVTRRRLPAALRVRTTIFQELNDGAFSQERVARALGMSSRTLRRRLAEEGVCFQQLLDDCRMRLAAFEFRVRRHTSIAQTALRLGYSEHSTFTRAFSRWSGMPPQDYIRQARLTLQ